MDLCPCSADVGDCTRCGKNYPPETMAATLPRHEEYGKPIPQKVSEGVKALRQQASDAYNRLDFKEVNAKDAEARAKEDEELKAKGIAGLYTGTRVQKPLTGKGKTRRTKTTGGDIVTCLLTIRNQVKLYHWQTGSFARHKATDDLTAALDLNIDAFVESYMGRYGRPKVSGSIKLHNFSESAAKAFVAQQTTYLTKVLPRKIKSTDTDLLNLRDTILGDLTKVLYLFTLA